MNELDGLLLHRATRRQLLNFISRPAHAVLLSGPLGAGKSQLACALAAELLDVESAELPSQPYFKEIERPAGKKEISIDEIRSLNPFLSLKVPGGLKAVDRVVFIKDAQFLSPAAQNALLKMLEEPPAATVFILSADSAGSLLPTITSRTQQLKILPPTYADAEAFYKPNFSQSDLKSAWLLSGGNAALMDALLRESDNHALKKAVGQAKQLLAQDNYQKLVTLNQLNNDKESYGQLLDALSRILSSLHHQAITRNNSRQAQKLLKQRQLVSRANDLLATNASPRLVSLYLALTLNL